MAPRRAPHRNSDPCQRVGHDCWLRAGRSRARTALLRSIHAGGTGALALRRDILFRAQARGQTDRAQCKAKGESFVIRLSGMSVDELRVRAVQALRVQMERVSDRFSSGSSTKARALGTQPTLNRGLEFLTAVGNNPAAIVRAIAKLDPQVRASFIRQSDDAEQGLVALLGYEPLRVGSPPRWQREARSGTEAPRRHWSRIDHLDTTLVGDHKLLWELNRHQYLLAPAFCWLLDRDPRRFELVQRIWSPGSRKIRQAGASTG